MKLIHIDKNSKIYFGNNFHSDLSIIFKNAKLINKRIILVTGFNSFIKSNYYEKFKNILNENGVVVVQHVKVKQNPKKNALINTLSKSNCHFDFIIAVGGGSVIDAGKLIKHYFNSSAKLLAVYTLCGSATIVSPFAVCDNSEFKIGIKRDYFIPNYSYINSQIIKSISIEKKLIAVSDIFAHAIESLYSKAANYISKNKSRMALNVLMFKKIEKLTTLNFIKSDIYAGLGEKVGLVLFPHAAGHYLTYKFNIPHGIATMYFLPQYLTLINNKGANVDSKYIKYSENLLSLLKQKSMIKKIVLSKKETVVLFKLTHKYLNFSYKNAPVSLSQEDYEILLKDYVKK
jgi:alcohol dehydrogenase class IV